MSKALFLLAFFAFFATPAFAGEVETEATILEVENKMSGRRSVATARVEFNTQEGKRQEAMVRLMHIPIVGSMKEPGDKIMVVYDTDNPFVVRAKGEHWIQQYGLYLAVGFVALMYLFRRMRRRKV